MVRRLLMGVVIGWCACAVPAYWLGGGWGLIGSAAAAMICALPATVSLHLYQVAIKRGRDAALPLLLGGMLFRVGFVLGVGVLLHATLADFDLFGFVLWLMLLYLITLAIEVRYMVSSLAMVPKS